MAASEITTLGNYLLIERLHLGEKGESFVAREADGDKQMVAVKRLLPQAAEDKQYAANFLLIAHLAAPLKHPAICAFHDFGSLEGVHYVAREYVGGKDLRDLQRRHVLQRRLIPDSVVLYLAHQLCDALVTVQQAADKGDAAQPRLYGDVDPRHVLIGFAGEVKLIGFGLQPRDGKETGPPDVKQLGATLYELVTGKPAWGNEEANTLAPPPHEVRTSVSKDLSKIIMRALGADGGFRSAVEVKQALDGLGAGAPDTSESAADLSALMKRIFAGALRIEKERARRVTTAAAPKGSPAVEKSAAAATPTAPALEPAPSAAKTTASTAPNAKSTAPNPKSTAPKPGTATASPAASQAAASQPISKRATHPATPISEPAKTSGGRLGYAALAAGILMLIAGAVSFATTGPAGEAPRPTAAADSPGQLQVVSEVPVDIFLDDSGAKLSAPLAQTVLPGAHGLTIVFRSTQRRMERQIEVKAGETVVVKLSQRPPAQGS